MEDVRHIGLFWIVVLNVSLVLSKPDFEFYLSDLCMNYCKFCMLISKFVYLKLVQWFFYSKHIAEQGDSDPVCNA